jgi:hypothetical protein
VDRAGSCAPPAAVIGLDHRMGTTVEQQFTELAEAMPENKWSFRPTPGVLSETHAPLARK